MLTPITLLLLFSASTLISYLSARFLIYFSHKHQLLDVSTNRSSHKYPTPRIGGLSFAPVILLLLAGFYYHQEHVSHQYFGALIFPPLLVATISIIDDIKNGISRLIRLLGHFIAGALTIYFLYSSTIASNLIIAGVLCFGICWYINLFNFMDGIDGIASTQALFIIASSAGFSVASHRPEWAQIQFCILAPLIGFLIINWQPAKIFMGDVGSTYLGLLIPTILLISVQLDSITIWSAILLSTTFLVDASWTLLIRIWTGQKWRQPHRSHLYQILSRKLSSHSSVSMWNALINVFWILPLSVIASMSSTYGPILTIFGCIPVLFLCIMHRSGFMQNN